MMASDKSTSKADGSAQPRAGLPTHEIIYQKLKQGILFGDFQPGKPVTLQGIADEMNASLTPIRESVRRLIAERALEFHDNRRISVPPMNYERLEEIYTARLALEPELAFRAASHAEPKSISKLEEIDAGVDQAILDGDTQAYLKHNFEFHRTLYTLKPSQILLPIVDSLWLQFAPSLRVVCARYGTSGLSDEHKTVVAALKAGDAEAVRTAIYDDISQGKRLIEEEMGGSDGS